MTYWTLGFMLPKNWTQPTPPKERLIELENYANFHGLRCVLDVSYTDMDGHTIRGNPKKIKRHIKAIMYQEFRGSNKMSNQEVNLVYDAWVEAIEGYRTDIILVEKYDRI